MARTDDGTAAVESALVFGLVAFMLFSIIEFGTIMNARLVISTAAREGARKATVDGGGTQEVYDRMRSILESAHLNAERTQLEVTPHEATFGTTLYVIVEYTYVVSTPLLIVVFGREVPLRSEVVCRSERVRSS